MGPLKTLDLLVPVAFSNFGEPKLLELHLVYPLYWSNLEQHWPNVGWLKVGLLYPSLLFIITTLLVTHNHARYRSRKVPAPR